MEYRRLGKTPEGRQSAYRALFRHRISARTLDDIRTATNKAWVLGNERFKAMIERKLDRRASPLSTKT